MSIFHNIKEKYIFLDKNSQGNYVTFPQMGSFEVIFMNNV